MWQWLSIATVNACGTEHVLDTCSIDIMIFSERTPRCASTLPFCCAALQCLNAGWLQFSYSFISHCSFFLHCSSENPWLILLLDWLHKASITSNVFLHFKSSTLACSCFFSLLLRPLLVHLHLNKWIKLYNLLHKFVLRRVNRSELHIEWRMMNQLVDFSSH